MVVSSVVARDTACKIKSRLLQLSSGVKFHNGDFVRGDINAESGGAT